MIERTPLVMDEGLLRRAVKAIKRRVFTPEFVRHCVTSIANRPGTAAKIKQRSTVHKVCRATYKKSQRKGELKRLHPRGSHHSYDEYVAAADKLGENDSEIAMIDKIKMKRLCESLGDRLPKKTPSNESGGTLGESSDALEEGKKKHHTPKFVQHCVSAITENPKELARIKRGGEGGEEGSPFAICWDNYNKNKKSLAAKHAKGDHHSVKDYEKSLKKLREAREAARAERPSPRQITFESRGPEHIKREARKSIRFQP